MCVTLRDILATEHHIFETMGTIDKLDDHTVWRCNEYPDWYDGNGIRLEDPSARTLEGWLDVFRSHFPIGSHRHVTISMEDGADARALANEARANGYLTLDTRYMYAADAADSVYINDSFEIALLSFEEFQRNRRAFSLALARAQPRFAGDADFHHFLDSMADLTSRVGIDWYRLSSTGSREIISSLGMFRLGSICRLQDVVTRIDARRRGHATALVHFAINQALHAEGAEAVVLQAEKDHHALDMYKKLGFTDVGGEIYIKQYPS